MSNRRSAMILLFACAAAAAANILLREHEDLKADGRTTLLDPSLAVESIRVEHRSSPPVVLEKSTSWQLTEPYPSSADAPVVLKLLDTLAFTPVIDAISESDLLKIGRTRSDFALDPPLVKISLSGAFGTRTISIGTPTPAADGLYASVDGNDSVLVVPSSVLSSVDLPAESFRRKSLFLIGPESVSSFEVKCGAGAVGAKPGARPLHVFSREAEGWLKDGKRVSPKSVMKFLTDLTAANADNFKWQAGGTNETDRSTVSILSGYGLDPEVAVVVTLKSLDGTARNVSFGKPADEGSVFALIQDGSAVATVPSALKEAAIQQTEMFSDSRLFPVEAKDVPSFSISDGDAVYAFARGEKGGWRFESPITASADSAAVDAMLAKILSLSKSDVDPGGIGISLTTNSAAVKVSRGNVAAGGFERLRSRQMLSIEAKDVKRIVSTPGGPTGKPTAVVYNRDRQAWNVESADGSLSAVSKEGVESVLSAIASLDAEKVEKLKVSAADLDRYGLGAPYFTVAVDQDVENSVRRNILIGAKTDGGRFATIGSADAVFIVSDAVTKALTSPLVANPQPTTPNP